MWNTKKNDATAVSISPQPEQEPHLNILIVDNDEMIRIFFRDVFWIHGREGRYSVEAVETLAEAEKIIRDPEKRPDMVFLDLMPATAFYNKTAKSSEIDGAFEFIRKFKADPNFAKMKIVIFSGHRDQDMKEKALALGVDGYLVKGDLMPKEIIDFVEKMDK